MTTKPSRVLLQRRILGRIASKREANLNSDRSFYKSLPVSSEAPSQQPEAPSLFESSESLKSINWTPTRDFSAENVKVNVNVNANVELNQTQSECELGRELELELEASAVRVEENSSNAVSTTRSSDQNSKGKNT